MSFGRLGLIAKIKPEAKNIIKDSCSGKLTANIFLGSAGVGKSTIAGLISTFPGIFKVGTTSFDTTTLGTWISTSITRSQYNNRARNNFKINESVDQFSNVHEAQHSAPLEDNFIFMDTEGLGYQSEYGKNYDVVTVLPNMLIAENVFVVVSGRLKPNDLNSFFDRFGEAASETRGLLPYRNKLFGNLVIIINKAQNWSEQNTHILQQLQRLILFLI